MLVTPNPLFVQDLPNQPPAMSGLSVDAKKDGDKWLEYRMEKNKSDFFEKRKKWFEKCNAQLDDNKWLLSGSNYLNLYTYPKFCNYFEPEELQGNWFSSSHCILDEKIENNFNLKDENENLLQAKHPGKELLTPEFLAKPGKLILLSVGTIVSFHLKIMNMLLNIVSDIEHKFVVSGGKLFDQIELPDNCVGASYLDQKELYPIVDCVITHGGE